MFNLSRFLLHKSEALLEGLLFVQDSLVLSVELHDLGFGDSESLGLFDDSCFEICGALSEDSTVAFLHGLHLPHQLIFLVI